jgi:hypothetical protein
VATDVNGNGKVDLICANSGDNTLSVLTNNGTGGFVLATTLSVGSRPWSVVAAAVNGDGKEDLICANSADTTLSVLTNSTPFLPTCTPPPSGLVSWWPGEGNANDIWSTNNGTLVNNMSFAPGEVGQAFSFNGSGYVSIPDSPSLDAFVSSITVEAWIQVSQWPGSGDHTAIVTKGDSSWRLQRYGSASTLEFAIGGLSPVNVPGTRNVNDGQWHHVAGVYDGTELCHLRGWHTGCLHPGHRDHCSEQLSGMHWRKRSNDRAHLEWID